MAECPVCAIDIELEPGTIKGELIGCPDCATELEVVSVGPVELDLAPELDEDWGQ